MLNNSNILNKDYLLYILISELKHFRILITTYIPVSKFSILQITERFVKNFMLFLNIEFFPLIEFICKFFFFKSPDDCLNC